MYMTPSPCIIVYCKDFCQYCTKAKDFLVKNKIPYHEVHLDTNDEEKYIQERDDLIARAGGHHKTFPFIFVGKSFLGGYTDLIRAYDTLKLHELCTKEGQPLEYDF